MSHLSFRPFIAISLSTLLGMVAAGPALAQVKKPTPKATKPAAKPAGTKPASGEASDSEQDDAEKKSDDKSKTTPAKPSDKSKGDVGVDLDEALKKKKKKEDRKPNFELRAVRTSPSDSIPFIKKNHWTLFSLQLIANNEDSTLEMRTGFQGVPDSPHDVQYRRLIHLVKEEERPYRLPVFLSHIFPGKTVEFGLYNPGGVMPVQPPGLERQPCTPLAEDQFLVVVLAATPDSFNFLRGMQWVLPGSETQDDEPADKRRYFHVVTALQPTKPLVADTALAWTTTSVAIWDDLDPGLLSSRQQEALVDWLYSGGTLVISGGPAATRLEESFLTPYLPADVAASSSELRDLTSLSDNYLTSVSYDRLQPTRKQINILPDKPVYIAKLLPRAGCTATVSVVGKPLLVERQVGRGRIVMAAFSLYQPELVNWGFAYDRFWREAILHMPETAVNPQFRDGSAGRTYMRLPARDLSNVRYIARDLGAGTRRVNPIGTGGAATDPTQTLANPPNPSFRTYLPPNMETPQTTDTVAEWRDDTAVPGAARQTLMDATGIKIPPPDFVLAAAVSYLVVLVPLNWLVCRFGFRRPELAWIIAPVIIVGFSIGIVRFAKVSVGFDMTSHEIDVVEAYDGHSRAHLSRFTCIYSGSRNRCEFRYEDQAAFALPMAMGKQRGQSVEKLALDWDMSGNAPVALGRYEVHPRSIGIVRAEEMRSLGGAFRLVPGPAADSWVIDNQTGLDLWDCHLVTTNRRTRLGDLAPGGKLEFAMSGRSVIATPQPPAVDESGDRVLLPEDDLGNERYTGSRKLGDLSSVRMLRLLDDLNVNVDLRAVGTRLVGWMPRPVGGQTVDPKPDRVVGFTVVVLHLEKP